MAFMQCPYCNAEVEEVEFTSLGKIRYYTCGTRVYIRKDVPDQYDRRCE